MINMIYSFIKNENRKRKWRKQNPHNKTYLISNGSPDIRIIVGRNTYGGLDVHNCTDNYLEIGSYCSIEEMLRLF